MADEYKDGKKPISSGMEPGPTEHRRDDMPHMAGTPLSTSGATGTTTSAAGSSGGMGMESMSQRNLSGQTQSGQTQSGQTQSGQPQSGQTISSGNMKENSARMASTAKQYAGDVANRAKEKSRTVFEQQKESTIGQVGNIAHAIRSTADNLHGDGQDQIARYITMAADQLESFGSRLRQKDLDTLFNDAQNLARRAPTTFIIGSVLTGFLLARFLKSSSTPQYAYSGTADSDERMLAAGEAGPYVGAAGTAGTTGTTTTTGTTGTTATTGTAGMTGTAAPVGADGTPGTGASTVGGTAGTGINGSNIGGTRL